MQCLVTVVLVFGGLGFYYFNYFQWRHFEAPTEGLTFVEGGTAPQLNSFSKQTTAKVIDATLQQNERLKQIRKALYNKKQKQFVEYTDFEQDCTEVKNRLLEIMNEARLRRIPEKFKKKYNLSLYALQDTYKSVDVLSTAFETEVQGEIKKRIEESIKYSKEAKKKLGPARNYFHSKDKSWAQ